jgi:hypothetical protein
VSDQVWDIRSTEGGSLGLAFARARVATTGQLLAHALPRTISVEVCEEDGRRVAVAERLEADGDSPMARLTVEGHSIRREQVWPDGSDIGTPVILPGGEVGTLTAWWNADDHSEWRWSVEFCNQR